MLNCSRSLPMAKQVPKLQKIFSGRIHPRNITKWTQRLHHPKEKSTENHMVQLLLSGKLQWLRLGLRKSHQIHQAFQVLTEMALPVAIMVLPVTGMTSPIRQSPPIAPKKSSLASTNKKLAESSTWKLPPPACQESHNHNSRRQHKTYFFQWDMAKIHFSLL